MGLIDYILNLSGLLLWLNWRTLPFDPLSRATPATLVGTLRRAEPNRFQRWHFGAALVLLVVLRAGFYRLIGPTVDWTATLNLVATRLAFRSDSFGMMLLFSVLSFSLLLGIFMLSVLLLSTLTKGQGSSQHFARLARAQLGFVATWPVKRKLLLPFVVGFVLWWLCTWPLSVWGLIPKPVSEMSRVAQAALVGLSAYFAWKYLIGALLGMYLLHHYLYFGRHAIWNFVEESGSRLIQPFRRLPLRFGKVDFAPLVVICVVFLAAQVGEHGVRSPTRLSPVTGRPEPAEFEIPGLRQFYERVSR